MSDNRPVVLVVDDDADMRVLAEMQLSEKFQVITAATGEEALEFAATRFPDVILLDMMMPGMDGSQVLDQLTKHPSTKDIPVIFLSSLSSSNDRVAGLNGGAIDFISKPADPPEFIARVTAAARVSAHNEESRRANVEDPLTGLPDRKAFEARLGQEMARARRASTSLTVFIVDVDGMDTLNESAGRIAGDELLRKAGTLLKTTLRASDVVFRYGGDEFAAILPDSEVGSSFLAAERCREQIRGLSRDGATVTVSIGVAELMTGRTAEELLAKAEIALFRAKESGGDRTWRSDDPRRRGMNPLALAEELTEREWLVLQMLADKRTEQDIASRMGIRPGTVRSHKARIRRKLNVSPEMRLSEFIKNNFRDLVARISEIEGIEERADT